jgi:hypothetical protein
VLKLYIRNRDDPFRFSNGIDSALDHVFVAGVSRTRLISADYFIKVATFLNGAEFHVFSPLFFYFSATPRAAGYLS